MQGMLVVQMCKYQCHISYVKSFHFTVLFVQKLSQALFLTEYMQFLCQLTLWHHSAVSTSVSCEQLLQKYMAQRHAVSFKKICYLSRIQIVQGMQICLFVCSPEPLQVSYPHPKFGNFNTFNHNFLLDY